MKAGHDIDRKGWLYVLLVWGEGMYKTVFMGKGAVWFQTVFTNMARVFYPHCFTALAQKTTKKQQKVIILDLGPENSFVKW